MTKEQFNKLKGGELIWVQDSFKIFDPQYRTEDGLRLYFLTYKPQDIKLATKEMVEEEYQNNLETINQRRHQLLEALKKNEVLENAEN